MEISMAKLIALIKALGGGGGGGGVSDVKVDGTSVVTDGVANVPMAGKTVAGAIKVNNSDATGAMANGGSVILNDELYTVGASKTDAYRFGYNLVDLVCTTYQHLAVFFGLAKVAGDTTQPTSQNAVGTYTENAKSKISQMLSAPETVSGSTPSIAAKPGVQYICGEVSTIDITVPESGIIDVIFESGSTPAVLTVTPPTGKTMKWANGFDPTNLGANTVYEINILDGVYGVVAAWT
ncbi:MAG: hypothetical protein IIZ68_06555 [Clostridia bacterium]|nr:hypothetical protein [Clostridia bacterium]